LVVEHRDIVVAWSAGNPWVTSHDDGDVLVVLDGQLHEPRDDARDPVALVSARYREMGRDFARGLLGDFVIVVLDRRRAALIVARDPLGVRPWYQAGDSRRGAGASDVATLCGLPWVDRTVDDLEALVFLAGYSYSRGRTLYRGIRTLTPGWTWRSSPDGTQQRAHHRWSIRPEVELGWDDAVQRCREVLDEVVLSRVRVAGAVTSQLSGGLDSTAVTGTAVRLSVDDLVTARLVFEGGDADERAFSDAAARQWGLRLVSSPPWILTENEAAEWTASLRRPIPDPNFSMIASLHRALLEEGRASVMTGLGGDDAFVARSRKSRVVSAFRHWQLGVVARIVREDLRHPRSAWPTWRGVLGYHVPRRPRRWSAPSPISASTADSLGLATVLTPRVQRLTGDRAIDERAHVLTSGYIAALMEELALVDDATGCRSTHPFLDPRFIEAVYGLNPWFSGPDIDDRELERAAFSDRLPPEVRQRRTKAEFSEAHWRSGLVEGHLGESLLTGPLAESGWVDPKSLASLVESARRQEISAARPIARARSLDRWLRLGNS
jgi:asparagine synthase (glutamine-hydrolysing)